MAKTYFWKFTIDGDAEKGVKALKKTRVAVDAVEKSEKAATRTRKDHTRVSDGLTRAVKNLAGPVALGLLARKFAQVAKEQDLMIGQLVTMTGAEDKAALAFEKLNQIATKTPFTLDQSVQAFVKLTALGLTPSERAILSYGNTASAMGKDLSQMIEAVADASTMEFERLKEFGIKARQQADTVSFTFQGVTTTVGKNASEIEEFLMGIGENQFGDAMANQMERIPGLLSNLSDNWDNLFRTIGEGGGSDLYSNIIKGLSSVVQFITSHVGTIDTIYNELIAGLEIGWASFSAELQKRIFNLNNNFSRSADHIKTVYQLSIAKIKGFWSALLNDLRSKYAEFVAFTAEAVALIPGMDDVAKNMRSTAMALRLAAAEGDGFAQTLAEITAEGQLQDEQRAAREKAFKAGVDRELADLIRMVNVRIQANKKEGESTEELDIALEDLAGTRGENAESMSKEQKEANELIDKMEEEILMISLSDAEKEFLNRTRTMSAEAIALEGDEIRRLIGILHSEQAAQKALAAQIKVADQIRKNQIENVQRAAGDLLFTLFDEGELKAESFFDTMIKGWKRMLAEMAAADLTKMLFGSGSGGNLQAFFGGGTRSGGVVGGASLVNTGINVASAAGSLVTGASSLAGMAGFGTLATTGGWVAPSMATSATLAGAGGAATGIGASLTAGLAAIPVWGWALLAAGAAAAIFNNDDGYKRANSGFLTAPTPGAKSEYLFDTPAFASGFSPIGVNRRGDQDQAEEVIDIFRSVDKQIFDLVVALNGTLRVGTLNGLNQEATPGSSGTFLGSGRDANLGQQVNDFVDQLADNIAGLDDALLDSVRSAGSAEEVVVLLTAALEKQGSATDKLVGEENRLAAARAAAINSYSSLVNDLLSSSNSAGGLKQSLQADIYDLLGVSQLRLASSADTPQEQIQAINQMRSFLLQQNAEAIAREQELHQVRVNNYKQQITLSRTISRTVSGILTGNLSPLSSGGKLDFATSEFNRLAGLAERGDVNAAQQVGAAGETTIKLIREMFANSSQSRNLTQVVIDRLLSIQRQLGSATNPGAFNPATGNARLVSQLSNLQNQLTKIQQTLAEDALDELKELNIALADLPAALAEILLTLIANTGLTGSGGVASVNPAATPELINQFAQQVVAQYGTGDEGVRRFVEGAIRANIGSKQAAEAIGLSQEKVIELAESVGLSFADGGVVKGPKSGYPVALHGTEIVAPLPTGFDIASLGNGGGVVQELRTLNRVVVQMSSEISELKEVAFSDARISNDRRIETNKTLKEISQKVAAPGEGALKYAR